MYAAATPSTGVPDLPLFLAGVEGSPCVIGRVVVPLAGASSAVRAATELEANRPELVSHAPARTIVRLSEQPELVSQTPGPVFRREVRLHDLLEPQYSVMPQCSDLRPSVMPHYSLMPRQLFQNNFC